jgi:hypothetical protein
MIDRAKAKVSSRKTPKAKKTTKSPRHTNAVRQVPAPPEPEGQRLTHRSIGNPQLLPSNRADQDSKTQVRENFHPQLLAHLGYHSLAKAMSLTDEASKRQSRAQ